MVKAMLMTMIRAGLTQPNQLRLTAKIKFGLLMTILSTPWIWIRINKGNKGRKNIKRKELAIRTRPQDNRDPIKLIWNNSRNNLLRARSQMKIGGSASIIHFALVWQ